ncbi:hypothetical protein A2229_00690 [Candidatus Peregrinibacteria bacterium RIFOXYA2_FULL_33_7]|nr:MAG: polysaccharide pyruvyl transferase CsaB [Candidatus Peregrinibacteria bacterium GW2011_GWC2_33_13]OGJ49444.1 MAG: hypothetical protein A2229_00690 [Candidatus Peregrinibacteria bacterium RIFOXYA2_FULL_33_7]
MQEINKADWIRNEFQSAFEIEISVLSNDPANTLKLHNARSYYLMPFGARSLLRGIFKGEFFRTWNQIKKADLVIFGGGGLFTDELKANLLWSWQALFCYWLDKKVWHYGQSVGPLKKKRSQNIVKKVMDKAWKISVRDQESKEILMNIGVNKEVEVRDDPALNLRNRKEIEGIKEKVNLFLKNYDLEPNEFIGVSLRKWSNLTDEKKKKVALFLDEQIEKENLKVLMVPFARIPENDTEILKEVKSLMRNQEQVIIKDYTDNFWEILYLWKKSGFILGMRLHSIIFAEIVGKPFYAISYSDKVLNFLKSIDKIDKLFF